MPKREVSLEQYFTTPELVQKCIELTNKIFPIHHTDVIIEPSAGSGAFSSQLPKDRTVALDIEPGSPEILKQDYFLWDDSSLRGSVLVIGNPPFGQRGSLAMRFMIKSCRFADCVAFILPRSFKKFTFQNRIPLNFHLAGEFDCEEFVSPTGVPLIVKAVFQVWVKKPVNRVVTELASTHPDFEMKHCHLSRVSNFELTHLRAEFPYALPQVGSNFSIRESSKVLAGSYWFIKPKVPHAVSVFRTLNFSFSEGMNTTFMSLSKKDIVRAYTENLASRTHRQAND